MKFSDFIFPNKLATELGWWLNNSTTVHSPLCFYGLPGSGKTTFARFISKSKSGNENILYQDMNSFKTHGDNFSKLLKRINQFASTFSLFSDDEDWNKVIILDEFHNLNEIQQDAFKVSFENWNDNGVQIIICLNITVTKPIDFVLSKAIKSRCECINFNYTSAYTDEMVTKVSKKYPNLKKEDIRCWLPDLRRIDREAKLSYGGRND